MGSVRVGVAVSDPNGTLAVPVESVPRASGRSGADLDRIAALASDYDAVVLMVGLPISLSGEEGAAAEAARAYARRLARRVAPRPVRLVDERLSTVTAQRDMRAAGVSSKQGRGRVDAAAAAVLLQAALDVERASGAPAGELLDLRRTTPAPSSAPPSEHDHPQAGP